jgi:osmoprotectant transport system ATP-binding protein
MHPSGLYGVAVAHDETIRLDGVGKTYPDATVAVHDLSLTVPRASVVCLVGSSGCGKPTTPHMGTG